MRVPGLAAPRPGEGGAALTGSRGLSSGVAIGLALGVVYAPCAGPILAAVITTSAAQTLTAGRIGVALAYGAGTGLVLYALMRGGRRLVRPLAARSGRFQQAMGVLMVLVGVAMFADLDLRFQGQIAGGLPAAVVNPTGRLEARVTEGRLTKLRGTEIGPVPAGGPLAGPVRSASELPVLATAPEFAGTGRWWNTAGFPGGAGGHAEARGAAASGREDRPLTLRSLRGRVVLIDFWTYSCINCIRNLPELTALDARYRRSGLVVVGIHSPEFAFERGAGNVARAIRASGIHYPVAQDNGFKTWDAWGNVAWPSAYLIDAQGKVRYRHAGEGAAAATEAAVRALLVEAGATDLPEPADPDVMTASSGVLTPETYLGSEKGTRLEGGTVRRGTRTFPAPPAEIRESFLAFGGRWSVRRQYAMARGEGAALVLHFRARRVYLVMTTSDGRPAPAQVLLDGRPIAAGAGADVVGGTVTVREQRLYRLVDLPTVRTGRLEIRPAPGVRLYAFTFG